MEYYLIMKAQEEEKLLLQKKKNNLERLRAKRKRFNEKGISIIECDKSYLRPLDVNTLIGDAKKARRKLKWKPVENINSLIEEMINSEYQFLNDNY